MQFDGHSSKGTGAGAGAGAGAGGSHRGRGKRQWCRCKAQTLNLQVALAGRNEETLAPLLEFLMKNVNNPHYSHLLVDLTNRVLDMYTPILGQSEVIDELFVKLRAKIASEVKLQKELQALTGMISLIMGSIADAPAVAELQP